MLIHIIDGRTVRRLRERLGLSVADLADKIGVSTSHMYKIEQGHKQPSRDTAGRIAETLGVDFEELCKPEPEETHEPTEGEEACEAEQELVS